MGNNSRRSRIAAVVAAGALALGAIGFGGSAAVAEETGTSVDWEQYLGDGRGPHMAEFAPDAPRAQAMAPSGVTRLQGANRYATAVDISKQNFAPGVDIAFIASGSSFPDALSGAPIAGITASPVLLVPGTSIPAVVQEELTRLAPQYIFIVGGQGVVSAGVEQQLSEFAAEDVGRLAGGNRFATSAFISSVVFSDVLPRTVFIANGMTFPDALAAGPAASLAAAPMLLVTQGAIPSVIAQELARLQPTNIVIMGGTGAVSAQVEQQLADYAPNVVRAFGKDRFSTAVDLSSWFWEGIETSTVFVANGMQFPDALAIAPVAATVDAPILLVTATSIPEVVKQELLARQPQRIVIVGGSGAVSAAVATQLEKYIVP